MSAAPVGLIGVGLLGTALAERFLGAGFAVLGHDLAPARLDALRALGGQGAGSAAEVARLCDRVVLSLPDTPAVDAVVGELAPRLRPGQVVVDTSTGDPAASAATGQALAQRGVHYLDATVAGSSEHVRQREGVVMVGGDRAAAEGCADLFAAFAREWFFLGPCGSGARMKLVVNLV